MDSKQVIEQLKRELIILKEDGHEEVSIESLGNYLDDLSSKANGSKEIQLALFNAKRQSNIEEYKERRAEWRELFKATVGHAQSAIKLHAIVNGGAAVALLTFIGKIWSPAFPGSPTGDLISLALVLYCCGVGAAAITQSLTYVSQHYFTYGRDTIGNAIRNFAQVTAISSLVLFFVATYVAYLGFTGTSQLSSHEWPMDLI